MRLSTLSAVTLGALLFTACPTPINTNDSGETQFDAGNPPDQNACSGGCASNQLCDTATRTCRDACGGCDAGTCVKVADNQFECVANAVTCNGNQCAPGQVACLGGSCSCLSSLVGGGDTCEVNDQWCQNGVCANPQALQECKTDNPDARCPTGYVCTGGLIRNLSTCMKSCTSNNSCDRGEACFNLGSNTACLALGLAADLPCTQNIKSVDDAGVWDGGWVRETLADGGVGGFKLLSVSPSSTCLLFDASDVQTDPTGLGTGTCQHYTLRTWDLGNFLIPTCRPPGTANEGEACKTDFGTGTVATQCNTGLVCVPTRGGDEGVCQRTCNANPPGYGKTQEPACNAGESCVNFLRLSDPDNTAVLGACMKSCDVFSADAGSCANVGTTPASCVPTAATGELAVSLDGKGVCMPQRASIAAVGQACSDTDAFHGAACASAQLCSNGGDINATATCTQVCDTNCDLADGGVAAGCAGRPNALCTGGKTCTRVNSTTGAHVGFCR